MQKRLFPTFISFLIAIAAISQPAYAPDIQKEQLNRGLICFRDGDSLIVSWRLLENEESTSFNIYKNDKLLNTGRAILHEQKSNGFVCWEIVPDAQKKAKKGGKIEIEYYSIEELERIVELLEVK